MAFHYSRGRLTQHLLLGTVIGGSVAVASTDAFASAWRTMVEASSERVLFAGGLMVLHTVVFWSVAGAFVYVDRTDRPAFVARHRIQPTKRKHPALGPTLRVLVRNQFLLLPLLLIGFQELLLLRGWEAESYLPSFGRLALELIGQGICATVVFYTGHRFLHRKWWMKNVHKVHHEFRSTTALASEYAHPVEFVVGNFGALVVGALVIAPHLASIYLFALVSLLTILVHHSGYALPWAPWSVPHDWHHYRFKELFGTTGALDRVFGTDKEFRTLEDGDIK